MTITDYWREADGDPRLRVLVACEESGTVRDAFLDAGHNAISCDTQPCSAVAPQPHILGDVLPILRHPWDIVIAHPPCTYLCNSGVCWLFNRGVPRRNVNAARWSQMMLAAAFFNKFLNETRHVPHVGVENPIPHGYARGIIGKYSQIIQPWQFGHPESKATCLWLRGLPPLKPTRVVSLPTDKAKRHRLHYLPPSPERAKLRSKTFRGIARAMAKQWGDFALIKKAGL